MQGNVYKKNETFNVDEAVLKAQVQASQQAAESAKEAAQRAADLIGENINLEEIRKELEGKLNVDGSNSNGVIPIDVSLSEMAEKDITGNDITSYVYNVFVEDGILNVIKGDKTLNQVQVSLTVDDALSKTSENPVQNKVLTNKIDNLIETINTNYEVLLPSFIDANVVCDSSGLYTINFTARSGEIDSVPIIKVDKYVDTVDFESENPVQNKVIAKKISEVDNIARLSLNGVNNAINGVRQEGNTIFFDTPQTPLAFSVDVATPSYVDDKIGEIETALDNIIAKYGLGGEA